MNVVYFYADGKNEWNCSQWNCINPTEAINRTKNNKATALHINEFVTNSEPAQKTCNEADIIVVERNYFGDTLTMMQYWKVRGKTVLAIFDDAYDIIHPENGSYRFWKLGEVKVKDKKTGKDNIVMMTPPPIEQFKWALGIVKGVQVVSKMLAKDWAKYGKTYHVNNFIPIQNYENIKPLFPHEDLIIGWCGSLSHYPSFTGSGIVEALENISKKYPKVKILISGDKKVYDLLNIENKFFQKYVPKKQWTSLLKTLDIGVIPLSGEYDKRRSWIKALENMALKVPWIATDYPTYDQLKGYGVLTENGTENWEKAISKMIDNYDDYKNIADTASYEFAKSQSIDRNIETVTLKLYEKLLNEPYP